MNKTAEQFARRPADAYLDAYMGNTVVINHDRYPDKVFELTARERKGRDSMRIEDIKGLECLHDSLI